MTNWQQLRQRQRQQLVVLAAIAVLTFAVVNIQAQAETQEDKDKPLIVMKINNPSPSIGTPATFYHVYNMTTASNLDKILNATKEKEKVQFNLDEIQLSISNTTIDYTIPFNIIDTSTPNIIRTKPDTIMTSPAVNNNYTKELNTQLNITTYMGQSKLFRSSELTSTGKDYDVDLKAIIYPNGTGVVFTTER